ncbi:hypothetical protein FE697_012165 [Mumia zhuanghuii]|uniref:Uncharacterized protein n=2 Tax=Mumia TaxID=1546255 RepID=A0ABW1QET4_9ACTN|nr:MULTISPECIES: hypothetical protein [Mumia]KAA1422893.1 hypothetical protein FE697_012165 [Mumia zhuanghuii]
MTEFLLEARARVLHDLDACRMADAAAVSVLEAALSQRGWWVSQWPDGAPYVVGLVAQDVQDALLDAGSRWPRCRACGEDAEHTLGVEPELGDDPHWVCTESGLEVARLGALRAPQQTG